VYDLRNRTGNSACPTQFRSAAGLLKHGLRYEVLKNGTC
jgi:hypothetical protein